MHHIKSLAWQLVIFCLMGSMSAWAGDVVLDNFTIGNPADDTSLALTNDIFDINEQLGQRFADNLFHSFFSFNIDNGETALFSGDSAIQNIISRVTGGDPSTIDGTVKSMIDGAGFWFINPAGMIIESNAMFDVSGSLALGAADFVEFENAERWYAFAPPAGETSTFSVAAPATFGFLDASSAGILAMTGFNLEVGIDDIVIAGGTVDLDASGVVTTANDEGDSGDIYILGGAISLDNGTLIGTLTEVEGDAGDIDITGTDEVTAEGSGLPLSGATIFSRSNTVTDSTVGQLGSGSAGNVTITGGTIDLADSLVGASSVSSRSGNSPASITIDAQGNSLHVTSSDIGTFTQGAGDAGTITLTGSDVSLDDDTTIIAATVGTGDASDIVITGTTSVMANMQPSSSDFEPVTIDSSSAIVPGVTFAGVDTDQLGSAGNVTITGGSISLVSVFVGAATQSNRVGNTLASVTLNAGTNRLFLSNADVFARTFGASKAGSLTLIGGEVSFNDTFISAEATESGDAGDIAVTASEDLMVDQGEITTRAEGSTGGDIQLTVDGRLTLRDSLVEASAGKNVRDAGDVSVTADSFIMQTSSIFARGVAGNGGEINLEVTGADGVFIKDSVSVISADSDTGTAGEVNLNAPDTDINSAIRVQDVDLFNAPALTADACSPAAWETRSSLVVEDRGGVPPAPDGYFPGSVVSAAPQSRETEVESGAHIDAEGDATTVTVASLPVAPGCR